MKLISWGTWNVEADACVVTSRGEGSSLWLAPIQSPLTLSITRQMNLPEVLDSDPVAGNLILDQMVKEVEESIQQAIRQKADGIAYILDGAYPEHTTPMQYGGFFLERDRELMELVKGLKFNLIFVEGVGDVYLDTVSDLPAHLFGWRIKDTGFTTEMMLPNRPGPFASFDFFSDVRMVGNEESVLEVVA